MEMRFVNYVDLGNRHVYL